MLWVDKKTKDVQGKPERHRAKVCTLTQASFTFKWVRHLFLSPPPALHKLHPVKSTWTLQSEACRLQFWKQFVPIAIFPFPPISFTYVTAIKGAHLTPLVAVERALSPHSAPALSIRLLLQNCNIINNKKLFFTLRHHMSQSNMSHFLELLTTCEEKSQMRAK